MQEKVGARGGTGFIDGSGEATAVERPQGRPGPPQEQLPKHQPHQQRSRRRSMSSSGWKRVNVKVHFATLIEVLITAIEFGMDSASKICVEHVLWKPLSTDAPFDWKPLQPRVDRAVPCRKSEISQQQNDGAVVSTQIGHTPCKLEAPNH